MMGFKKYIVAFSALSFILILGALSVGVAKENQINGKGQLAPVIYTDVWSTTVLGSATTYSTTWEPIPDTSMTIDTLVPSDLIIMFSAEAVGSANGGQVRVKVQVDGVDADPNDVVFNEGNSYAVVSMKVVSGFNFHVENLEPGTHTIQVFYKTNREDTHGSVSTRTLTVLANGAGHL